MAARGVHFWDGEVHLTQAASRLHDATLITSPYHGNPVQLTLFVSCYNESAYIIATLDTVRAAAAEAGLSYEILIIDDGSKDNSVALVKQYIADHPEDNIVLRINAQNKGWAQNYFDAAFIGRGTYLRAICGDNSETAQVMVTIFRAIGQADIVVPYYTHFYGKSLNRRIISKLYTAFINFVTGYRLHYYNGLAVHLRHNVMRWHSNTHGFGFQADVLCLLLDMGFTYVEVPVVTEEKRAESSNAVNLKNILSVMHTLAEIIIRRISHRVYKKRA